MGNTDNSGRRNETNISTEIMLGTENGLARDEW